MPTDYLLEDDDFLLDDEDFSPQTASSCSKEFKPIRFQELKHRLETALGITTLISREELLAKNKAKTLGDFCIEQGGYLLGNLLNGLGNCSIDLSKNYQDELSFFKAIQRYLDVDLAQALLIAPLINSTFVKGGNSRIAFDEMLGKINVHPAEKYALEHELLILELRHLIYPKGKKFELHSNFLSDLMHENPSRVLEDKLGNSILNLFDAFEDLEEWPGDKIRLNTEHFISGFNYFGERYGHYTFMKKLKMKSSGPEEFAFLLYVFSVHLRQDRQSGKYEDTTIQTAMQALGRKSRKFKILQEAILHGQHWTVKDEWIINRKQSFKSSCLVANDFVWDWILDKSTVSSTLDLHQLFGHCVTSCDTIVEKELFHNSYLRNRLGQIENLCTKDNYEQLQQKLSQNKLGKSLSCLLYGAPGTGKTQFVKNLASKTGRDIISIDSATIRGSYYGESENNLKKIFHRYANYVKDMKNHPILLFNEADQLLYSRGGDNSSHQTSENLINLMLDALENFEGILFATSNLSTRLDPAFERRFLYKIELESPGKEALSKIWTSHFPWLQKHQTEFLIQELKLSPALIENVKKEYILSTFDQSEDPGNFNLLMEIAQEAAYNFEKFS